MTNRSPTSSHILKRIVARLLFGGIAAQRSAGRRRNLYVGGALQDRLIAALVVMEALLVAASVWLLYRYMDGIIDEHLYRGHLATEIALWPLLTKAAFAALVVFVLANGTFLLIAVAIWGRYVSSIMARFMTAVRHAGKLDFRSKPAAAHRHEVMALTDAWLSQERRRIGAIRDEVARLEAAVAGEEDRETLTRGLARLLALAHPVVDARRPDAGPAREGPA